MRRFFQVLLATCALCTIGFLVCPISKEKKEKIAPYSPKTWSTFQEYKRLKILLEGFGIESLLDIPACDVENFREQDFGKIRYIGIASSKDQAAALQAHHGLLWRQFSSARIAVDSLPRADLILCWDRLCALPSHEVLAALLQFKKSGAKFLLMRHYPNIVENAINETGEFQPINWKLAPYFFPEPIIHIMERREDDAQTLALWSLENLL